MDCDCCACHIIASWTGAGGWSVCLTVGWSPTHRGVWAQSAALPFTTSRRVPRRAGACHTLLARFNDYRVAAERPDHGTFIVVGMLHTIGAIATRRAWPRSRLTSFGLGLIARVGRLRRTP
jgi:hypothetical protein